MHKICIIFTLLFIISCASNIKVSKEKVNYDNLWIKTVGGKSVLAPNGFLYTFKENGNVEYKVNGILYGKGIFLYAESETNAYYYEKLQLNNVAYDILGAIPSSNVNIFVGFIVDNNTVKMTSGYTKEYYDRLSNWKKNNLTIFKTLRDGRDMSEYPIPFINEVNLYDTIEFGKLR